MTPGSNMTPRPTNSAFSPCTGQLPNAPLPFLPLHLVLMVYAGSNAGSITKKLPGVLICDKTQKTYLFQLDGLFQFKRFDGEK